MISLYLKPVVLVAFPRGGRGRLVRKMSKICQQPVCWLGWRVQGNRLQLDPGILDSGNITGFCLLQVGLDTWNIHRHTPHHPWWHQTCLSNVRYCALWAKKAQTSPSEKCLSPSLSVILITWVDVIASLGFLVTSTLLNNSYPFFPCCFDACLLYQAKTSLWLGPDSVSCFFFLSVIICSLHSCCWLPTTGARPPGLTASHSDSLDPVPLGISARDGHNVSSLHFFLFCGCLFPYPNITQGLSFGTCHTVPVYCMRLCFPWWSAVCCLWVSRAVEDGART